MPPMIRQSATEQYRVPKPKSIKEVPSFVIKVLGNFFGRLFYIYRLVWETSPITLFIMIFMAVFTGVMPLVGALISRELLNRLTLAVTGAVTGFNTIIWLLVAYFAYMFINTIVNSLYAVATRIAGEMVSNHIKVKIMNKAKQVDLKSFDLPEFYTTLENANREAANRPVSIVSDTARMASAIISMISFIIVLFSINVAAPFVVIAFAIPTAIIDFIYRRKNVQFLWRRSKERRQMSYYSDVIVNKDNVKEMKIFGLTDTFIGKYKNAFSGYFAEMKHLLWERTAWNSGALLVTNIVNCVLFVLIAAGVFDGRYQIGDYSLYTGALTSIASAIASIITYSASIYEGTLFINNLISYLDEKPTVVPQGTPIPLRRHVGHTIKFEDVSFVYPGTERAVLDHINLEIDAGDTVVIVGLNGAGKTTLIKLLTRLYDPTSGRILLDGEDIRRYDPDELYKMFGIIFQDFGKYALSVAENIHLGQVDKQMTAKDIEHAAKMGDVAAYIEKLPDKYDTPLMRWFDENATDLSIGQWQKISIARAFYSDSDIMILDEPTASLDPIAEQQIFNRFDELRQDKTTIFVSHRLSSATVANKIVVLDGGRVAEIGNHSQLMNLKGQYYKLFSTQAKRYTTPIDENDVLPPQK